MTTESQSNYRDPFFSIYLVFTNISDPQDGAIKVEMYKTGIRKNYMYGFDATSHKRCTQAGNIGKHNPCSITIPIVDNTVLYM